MKKQIIYRGSLKSCNYKCSYCPFAKHPGSERELRWDREQWFSFLRLLAGRGESAGIGALLVAPYGEALIHPWYWEGLAELSKLPWMDAVGSQTNLSFAVDEALGRFAAAGGHLEKLRLWATFHPEMTEAAEFAGKCRQAVRSGIAICAGAVGSPGSCRAGVLRELKQLLPKECYFWINRMDGLDRAYTQEEVRMCLELDPYFYRERMVHPADPAQCAHRLMAEGDGRLRTCNISQVHKTGWMEGSGVLRNGQGEPERADGRESAQAGAWGPFSPPVVCSRRRCSCYLAYGGRANLVSQLLFGPYPAFRIPRRPKAVFLDIVGTLLPQKDSGEPEEELAEGLRVLAGEGVPLFFATTLPYEKAARRCRKIWHLFSGGVFAGGAHVCIWKRGGSAGPGVPDQNRRAGAMRADRQIREREVIHGLDEELLSRLERSGKGYRVLAYRKAGRLCKITLWRAARRPWTAEEADGLFRGGLLRAWPVRYLIEENCLQMIAEQAGKAQGVQMICDWLGIAPAEAFAAGDSAEDTAMMRLCQSDFS